MQRINLSILKGKLINPLTLIWTWFEFIEAQSGIIALSNFLTWFLRLENNCLLCRRKSQTLDLVDIGMAKCLCC